MKSSPHPPSEMPLTGLLARSQRGQALLIAVLVLFAVATLAALFAAIVGAQLAQVSRHGQVVALRNIAEAGLRLANEQLAYSKQGADWRPAPGKSYRCGDGEVTITLSYGPAPDEIQSRFLRIVSTAVFPDNPFLRHTIVALKPILLTDYARFITDRFQTNRRAALGVTGLELGGLERDDYVFAVEGPIRSNTDLVWYGRSLVSLRTTFDPDSTWRELRVLRDDRIEVAGRLMRDPGYEEGDALELWIDGGERAGAADLFAPTTDEERFGYQHGFGFLWEGEIVPNSRAVLAQLPDYYRAETDEWLESEPLAVPRVRPPQIDAIHPDKETNRYLLLTRDTGFWLQDADGTFYNTGEFGWGWSNYGGIYIDNASEVQYDHDLEKLRLNWLRSVGAHEPVGDRRVGVASPPSGSPDWWDQSERYYAPPGVEIILHGEAPCPYVEIIRHDLRTIGGTACYWQSPDGEPISSADASPDTWDLSYGYVPVRDMCTPASPPVDIGIYDGNRAIFPFPPNGTIYAEGNVRVRGVMPPVRDRFGNRGPDIIGEPADIPYFGGYNYAMGTGRDRRFDLQVVSGGTIYIEGDLLTANTAGIAGLTPGETEQDFLYGSRLALLARDSVCLNTTALNPRPAAMYEQVEGEFFNDPQPVYPRGAYPSYLLLQGYAMYDYTYPDPVWTDPPGIGFEYSNVRLAQAAAGVVRFPADIRLILGHSGWYAPGGVEATGEPPAAVTDDNEADVRVTLDLNRGTADQQNLWTDFTFKRAGLVADSSHWYTDTDQMEPLPSASYPMDVAGLLTGADRMYFAPEVMPIQQIEDGEPVGWEVAPWELGYLLGPVAIAPPRGEDPLHVTIEALIYAQNGSWFVIPGRWFNEDPSDLGLDPTEWPYPGYHEPLNIRISVYGAIAENMPADLGSVAEWTSKWGGPLGQGDQLFLSYAYDPLLRAPRGEWRNGERVRCLRFPNLPTTTDLVIWGERVTGPPGG